MLPESFLDELRARVPVSAVVGRRVKLDKAGHAGEHKGCCPFHNEKTASFTVSDDKGFFHCFGCGAHGDVIEFEMRSGNLPFMEAIERLAADAGLEVPRKDDPEARRHEEKRATLLEALEAACRWYEERLRRPEGAAGLAYLLGRGLSEETIARFRLGWAPAVGGVRAAGRFPEDLLLEAGLLRAKEDGSRRDMFRGRVMFPVSDRRGRIIGFGGRILEASAPNSAGSRPPPKYINSPATPVFDKGAVLYGLALAREGAGREGRAVVVEGYMDVIGLHQAGLDFAVAPLGTALTPHQLDELWRLAPAALVCLDGDAAGQKAAARVAEMALARLERGRSLRFVTLTGSKDPDELVRRWGGGAMRGWLKRSRPLADVAWGAVARLEGGGTDDDDITPEQIAEIEARAWSACAAIPDAFVRRAYLADFRRRLRGMVALPDPAATFGRSAKNFVPRPRGDKLALEWEMASEGDAVEAVWAWLGRHGIARDALTAAIGGIGLVRARVAKGRWAGGLEWAETPRPLLWEPDGDVSLVIVPEWDGDHLLDLVGWNARTGALYGRTGAARLLGEGAAVEAAGFEARGLSHPLRVAATPLSWLRNEAAGDRSVLVVDWGRAWPALGGLRSLVAETRDLALKLDEAIRAPKPRRPEIAYVDGAA